MTRKPIKKGKRYDVLRKSRFRCHYCGAKAGDPGVQLQVDHVVPVSRGGTNDIENLVAACRPCNIGKGTKVADPPRGGPVLFLMPPTPVRPQLSVIDGGKSDPPPKPQGVQFEPYHPDPDAMWDDHDTPIWFDERCYSGALDLLRICGEPEPLL